MTGCEFSLTRATLSQLRLGAIQESTLSRESCFQHGVAEEVIEAEVVLDPPLLPEAVWINRPETHRMDKPPDASENAFEPEALAASTTVETFPN